MKVIVAGSIKIKDIILGNLLQNKSCQSFDRNLSLPISPSITYRVNPFLTLFKCNNSQKIHEDVFNSTSYQSYNSCESFILYYNQTINYFHGFPLPTGCSFVQLPKSSSSEAESNDLFDLLTDEVTLGWTVSDECNQCYYRGGKCQTDNTTDKFLCYNTKVAGNIKMKVIVAGARGTIGYIAPEIVCRNLGGVSHKSDVYSYGMMVLEMVGGRKNVDVGVDHTSEIYFPHWLYRRIELDEELQLIGITNEEEKECAKKMVIMSLWCIQTDPLNRPSMSKVVEMLEGNQDYSLQIPPKPYLYFSSRSEVESSSVAELR
ncbi:G-type lectin S-receptor-like serine/threonine-protein kinase At2g19130 [Nicotiana tabacum]|uniref:G-type lectin S-receptor-like serine/threonine-protein kinase At2g19130 n=1 Tax=Nicotiana tabacum TaxID=4097 RepID=A0AC58U1S5_TOBAC